MCVTPKGQCLRLGPTIKKPAQQLNPSHLLDDWRCIGAAVAALFGLLLGAPTLRLRGDYLAIVTLGFGEIIRIFLNNLDIPISIDFYQTHFSP